MREKKYYRKDTKLSVLTNFKLKTPQGGKSPSIRVLNEDEHEPAIHLRRGEIQTRTSNDKRVPIGDVSMRW